MIADPYPATVLPDALAWDSQYRIVPSRYLPVNFFEDLVDPELMEEVYPGFLTGRLAGELNASHYQHRRATPVHGCV